MSNVWLAFVITLLLTLTCGAVFIGISAGKSEKGYDIEKSNPELMASTTRVPFSESISIENNSENGNENVADLEEYGSDSDMPEADSIDVVNSDEPDEPTDTANEDADAPDTLGETYWERSISTDDRDYVSLAFAGDILFDPGYAIMNKIRQNGGGIEGVIGGSLLSYMRSADIMVVNNEFPYSDRGTPTEGKTFTFRASPSSAALLGQMGVDVATLANNHAYDYGETALLDSLNAIDGAGVARIGAGSNIEEASHPIYYTTQNGIRIALIAATQIERLDNPDTKGATESSPGVFRCLDISKLLSRIQEAKETGAFVIVCIHWGTENKEEIDWWQEKQSAEIAQAGADLIVGAHPHSLQKIGYVDGVPVIYSLGNYLFNSKTINTGLLRVNVYKDLNCDIQFIPAIQSDCKVNEALGNDKSNILGYMRSISAGLNIDENGYVTK